MSTGTQEKKRAPPLSPSPNHDANTAKWALMVREVGRGRKPFVPREELKKLLQNDSQPQHIDLLYLITTAVVKERRATDSNYYFIAKKGSKELWAGFAVSESGVSAPAAHNISSRHYFSPLVFEVREKNLCLEKMLAAIAGGKLEIVGDHEELLSFLHSFSWEGANARGDKKTETRRRKPKNRR